MARTFRKVSIGRHDWSDEMEHALRHGLISIPKSDTLGDEVWGQLGKKDRKRRLARQARRNVQID